MNEQTRKGRIRTVTDAVGVGVGEDGVLAEVGEPTRLLDEGGREAVRVGLVVDELRGHEVPNLHITVVKRRSGTAIET